MAKELTLQELQQQIAELTKKADALREVERGEAIERCKAQIDLYGLTAADIGLEVKEPSARAPRGSKAVSAGSGVAPKYRNPANYQQTWSGRGRKPQWFETYVSNGGDIDKLLIK